jgi:hypothetical protein
MRAGAGTVASAGDGEQHLVNEAKVVLLAR